MMWKTKWIFTFFLGFGYLNAQVKVVNLYGSSKSTTVGSQFNITCDVENLRDDILYIKRKDSTICGFYIFGRSVCDRDSGMIFTNKQHYSCGCAISKRNVTLNVTIKETRKEDNGTWICDSRDSNRTLPVIVNYPPTINKITIESDDEEIKEGSDVKLSCIVDSIPQSNITWSKNGIQIKNGVPDFIVTKVACLGSESYTCWAGNGIGSNASKTEQIDVNCSPWINSNQKPQTVITASSGDSVNFTAHVMAYPVPTFSWKYLLEDKTEKRLTNWRITTKSNKLTSYLYLENITKQDFGSYIMYAKNKEGETSIVFNLVEDLDADTVMSSDNQLGTGIGIGFIVGLLVMGAILGAVAFLVWKKRRGARNASIHVMSSLESTTVGSSLHITCDIKDDYLGYLDDSYITRNGLPICTYNMYTCDRYMGTYFKSINEYYSCDCDYDYSSDQISINLTIKETRKEDHGAWVCGVESMNKTLSLQVEYPPSINDITIEPDNEEIREGSDVKLSCIVDSFPQSNITWSKNGAQIKNGGPDIFITNAKCEDSGSYICWAENGVGMKTSEAKQIGVICAPRLNLIPKPNVLIWSPIAGSVTLTATVISYPDPIFTWKHLLENNTEIPITDVRITDISNKLTSYLEITNITDEDFRRYIMYANNYLGETYVVFNLKETKNAENVIADVASVEKQNDDISGDTLDTGNGTGAGIGTGAGTGIGTSAGIGTGAGTGIGTGAGTGIGTGAGIGIGFIVGLLVMVLIIAVVFLFWKKRGTGKNIRQMLQYKKKSSTRRTGATETVSSDRQPSSTQPTTFQPDHTYEGLDMEGSEKQIYEEFKIYENHGVV